MAKLPNRLLTRCARFAKMKLMKSIQTTASLMKRTVKGTAIMNDRKKQFRKALKAFCVLLALLSGLFAAAAGEDATVPAAAEAAETAVNESAADETTSEAVHAPEEKHTDPAPESAAKPAKETPSKGNEDVPEVKDPDSVPEIPAEPEEEARPEESEDDSGKQVPEGRPDAAEEAAPAKENERKPVEYDTTPEESGSRDGIFRVNEICEITLQESRLYSLTLRRRQNLILKISGVPVKITIIPPQNGRKLVFESAADKESGAYAINEPLTLEKGEYSIAVEPLREKRQGTAAVCFAIPETAAETPEAEAVKDGTAEEIPDAEPEESAEPNEPAEPEEDPPDAAPDAAEADGAEDENAGEAVPAAENDEQDAAGDGPGDADEAGEPGETAEKPLTVKVTVSCEEGLQPGARIVLTAELSDPACRGTIRWQYSADGGATVHDVEGAEGAEYSFLLDEVNHAYWWRAYVE